MKDENDFDVGVSYEAMRSSYLLRVRLFRTVLITIPVLFLIAAFTLPLYGIVRRYEELLAARVEGMRVIPDLEAKITALDKSMKALTPQSVEQRLSAIEKAISTGSIKPDELTTLQDIRTEVAALKSYMMSDPDRMPALRKLQDDYQGLRAGMGDKVSQKDMDSEMRHLTNLIYLSLAFFGILFTVVFGAWWFIGRKRPPTGEPPTMPVSPPVSPAGNGGVK